MTAMAWLRKLYTNLDGRSKNITGYEKGHRTVSLQARSSCAENSGSSFVIVAGMIVELQRLCIFGESNVIVLWIFGDLRLVNILLPAFVFWNDRGTCKAKTMIMAQWRILWAMGKRALVFVLPRSNALKNIFWRTKWSIEVDAWPPASQSTVAIVVCWVLDFCANDDENEMFIAGIWLSNVEEKTMPNQIFHSCISCSDCSQSPQMGFR